MPVIGLTGGIASGKTVAAGMLAERGAVVIDADQLGHEALHQPAIRQALVERWGSGLLAADGTVQRAAIARRVFASDGQGRDDLAFLERQTHPWIEQRLRERVERWRAAGSAGVVVLDAALLWEAGWHRWCDRVIFVDAPVAQREQRAVQRGWTPEQFRDREATQVSTEWKRRRADLVWDNSGTLDQLASQVDAWWKSADFS